MKMRLTSQYLRRLVLLGGLLLVVFCGVQLLRSDGGYNEAADSNLDKLMRISQSIKSFNQEARYVGNGVPACKFPELDINNSEILKFIHEVPALQCAPEDWVKADGPRLYVDEKAKQRFGPITCAFSEILRVDDFSSELAGSVESDQSYVLRQSDYADVKCESRTGKQWHGVLAAVREEPSPRRQSSWSALPRSALPLNVLMFGFDSLSRNTFERKLPRSYAFLRQALGGLVLEGYNIVGDGTPQALIPILTGKIELELPDARKRMADKASYVDVYPLVWKDYKAANYLTGFMEDVPHIGTFTYRLKGFQRQPTDHYMRTYYLAAAPYFKYSKPFCMGGLPRHALMLDHIRAIFDEYRHKPKFIFGFHGELSHDSYNDIGVADDDLLRWMKQLKDSGHLNNTILIVMSDHGHRFADIRNTLQGKQEERLPFFSFTFPPWFKQVYPQAYANFLFNTQHLTTPFDIHATLKHILNFEKPKEADLSNRAISLFDKIPIERTCADAFIEPHWCACLTWQEISVDQPIVQRAAKFFVEFLNFYTGEHRDICQKLHVGQVMWASKLIPTKGLLHFERSRDADGFVAALNAKTQLTTEIYQLKIKTLPGNGLFEASISHDVQKDIFSTKISDVSRINMYGSQARCVEHHLFHLRKYCYCKD
ncbi:uncharacterized protein LOC131662900 [Phymastichus coffea]|uniref:uncharacterized protein LOC131662900 n=1 Tax=Phymastichus coffea TaxID=108790 RepID=UPI00273AD33F|nr:uncharacterized protein LOC131662900 [Phymastichus coffea]XP_058788876.1 uncharacterized protein LOC131662900 [Phymastichus coffea]XP_058788884.1 uncharacterized protein LOC131662900 [Phymastichus coffea]XP_058788894.1 uncharacterized protein LOC131662900 [Phymastichus coffea]